MRRKPLGILAGLCLSAVTTPPAFAQNPACNRTCLTSLLDRYLAALAAHDSGKAPLAAGFRQTDNAVAVAQDEGLWRAMDKLGALQRRFYDPANATAAYLGTLQLAGGEPAIVSLRLHQSMGRIDEAEWHVTRGSDPGIAAGAKATFDLGNLLAHPPQERVVPAAQRLSRAQLIAIANSYFDGITAKNARIIQAHKGCERLENGTGAPPGVKDEDGGPPDCMSGQGKFGVAFVSGRRYPLVDESAQVVLAIGTFVREPGNPKRRNHFMEFFYIDHAKIRQVYAAFFYPPSTLPVPNWPPYDGNFPLPADFGAAK